MFATSSFIATVSRIDWIMDDESLEYLVHFSREVLAAAMPCHAYLIMTHKRVTLVQEDRIRLKRNSAS